MPVWFWPWYGDCSQWNSIDEYYSHTSLVLFPNPVLSRLYFDKDYTECSYSILNVCGKIIQQGWLETNSIAVDNIPNGIYLLNLTDKANNSLIAKLIKQ